MSEIIENYYRKTKLEDFQIKSKMDLLDKHNDIKAELEYWIQNQCYKQDGIVVEGFSAESLAKESKLLDGEGAFIMLIKLRERPEVAKRQIANGFIMK